LIYQSEQPRIVGVRFESCDLIGLQHNKRKGY